MRTSISKAVIWLCAAWLERLEKEALQQELSAIIVYDEARDVCCNSIRPCLHAVPLSGTDQAAF